jgi:hypothetical protein
MGPLWFPGRNKLCPGYLKNIWKIKEKWSIYIYGPWLSVHSYHSCFCKVDHDLVESSECCWTEVCKCCLTSKSNGFPCSMTGLILVELILFAWWDNILAPLAYRIFECLRIAFRFTYKSSMYMYAVWSSFHFNCRTNTVIGFHVHWLWMNPFVGSKRCPLFKDGRRIPIWQSFSYSQLGLGLYNVIHPSISPYPIIS